MVILDLYFHPFIDTEIFLLSRIQVQPEVSLPKFLAYCHFSPIALLSILPLRYERPYEEPTRHCSCPAPQQHSHSLVVPRPHDGQRDCDAAGQALCCCLCERGHWKLQ